MIKIISNKIAEGTFYHKSHIPRDVALAVYRIMHNKATANDWETLDQYRSSGEPVLKWIYSILEDNGVPDINAEMNWWKTELSFPYN